MEQTSKEIFEDITELAKKYVTADMIVVIKKDPDEGKLFLESVDKESISFILGLNIQVEDIIDDIQESDWPTLLNNANITEEGEYYLSVLFNIDTDYDDYISWRNFTVTHIHVIFCFDPNREELSDPFDNI
jgi:hypothetical protein